MSSTIKHFPRVTPQPWKYEVPRPLDMEKELSPSREDITTEYYITDLDGFMEDDITEPFKRVDDGTP